MAGLEERLSKALGSPEEMAKIAAIARALSKGIGGDTEEASSESGAEGEGAEGKEEKAREGADAGATPKPAEDSLSSLGLSPRLLGAVTGAAAGLKKSDKRLELLHAARPFASGEGAEILERAIRAIKLAKAARAAIGSMWGEDNFV